MTLEEFVSLSQFLSASLANRKEFLLVEPAIVKDESENEYGVFAVACVLPHWTANEKVFLGLALAIHQKENADSAINIVRYIGDEIWSFDEKSDKKLLAIQWIHDWLKDNPQAIACGCMRLGKLLGERKIRIVAAA